MEEFHIFMYWFIIFVQNKKSIRNNPRLYVCGSYLILCLSMKGSIIDGYDVNFDTPLFPRMIFSFTSINIITSWCCFISCAMNILMHFIIFARIFICSIFHSSIIFHCWEWIINIPIPSCCIHVQYAAIIVNLLLYFTSVYSVRPSTISFFILIWWSHSWY